MDTENKFRGAVRTHLDRLSDQLVPVLKQLVAHYYPEEVFALCFEIFPSSFCSQFPIRAFFMDSENSEHFLYIDGEAGYPSPVDPGLLDIPEVYPSELEEEFEEAGAGIDLWSISSNEAAIWFYDCWLKAGGNTFPLEATIAEHDSEKELNLKTGAWQESYALFAF